jgi:hypothetical protein
MRSRISFLYSQMEYRKTERAELLIFMNIIYRYVKNQTLLLCIFALYFNNFQVQFKIHAYLTTITIKKLEAVIIYHYLQQSLYYLNNTKDNANFVNSIPK